MGCSSYCPVEATDHIPVVATSVNVNIEKTLMLKPDLVFVSSLINRETIDNLKKLGIRVENMPYPKSFEDICTYFISIGELTSQMVKATKIIEDQKVRLENLRTFSLRERAQNIAIVNQYIESCDMNVEEYVLMGRIPYHSRFNFFDTDKDFEIVYMYLGMADTLRFKDKRMSELSGGEQQLATIAQALTQQPQLLLLD